MIVTHKVVDNCKLDRVGERFHLEFVTVSQCPLGHSNSTIQHGCVHQCYSHTQMVKSRVSLGSSKYPWVRI